MENKKILEAARNNKYRGREYENKESVRGNLLGTIVAILTGIVLFGMEYLLENSVNIGLLIVGLTTVCVQALYEGIKNKKVYLIIIGGIETLVDLVLFLIFIVLVV